MKIINSIHIKNYKSLIEQKIVFDDMTSFVGANESGKSNILSAINHLEKNNQKKIFDISELNLSAQHQADEEIRIDYEIILSEFITPNVLKALPMMDGKKVVISKYGEPRKPITWDVNIDQLPTFGNILVRKGKQTQLRAYFKDSTLSQEDIDHIASQKWFLSGGVINMTKKPFCDLEANGVIDVLRNSKKKEFVKEKILEEVLKNIQIYFWKYDSVHYLKEAIPLADFCANPYIFHSVYGIFKIAQDAGAFNFNITPQNLDRYLQKSSSTSRTNLLNEVSKKFNKIFNKSWKTLWGDKVKLILSYEGTNLTFRFDDGRQCPPEYRSDGFKWFITFLINFQSKEETLSNYVLLMDEPGGTLHPKGQKDALEFLNKLNKKNQIIYSTHQTFLLDKNKPFIIRILDRTKKDTKHDFFPTIVNNIRDERRHILSDSLLREALGFSLTDISPINESNILVEGSFDRSILYSCNEYFNILNLNFISIIDCGKASNIKFAANQYRESGLKVLCVYDRDESGKKYYEDNKIEKKFKIYISDNDGYTIEDLLPDKVVRDSYEGICKKHVNNMNIMPFQKPFIASTFNKSFMGDLQKGVRGQIKHELEDIMIRIVKSDLKNNSDQYNIFCTLLKKIKLVLE